VSAAQKAADDGVTVYTVGVGTSQGELIPDPDRPGIFLKDDQGSFVRSRLDENTLRQIATITGGIYVPLGRMGQGLMRIYQEKLKLVPAQEHQERREQRPIERFYWPLAVALFLFLAEFLIGERRKKGATNRAFLARLTNNTLKLLIVCIFLVGRPVHANGLTADQLYHQGRLEEAGKKYRQGLARDPDNSALHYNLGDVLYRQKQYDRAAAEFEKALASDDLTLQAKSYFNLGNSHFQMAAAAGGKLDSAEKEYRQAMQAYESSLALNPDDADARANLELTRKRLQQIQKKQKNRENRDKQEKEKKDTKKQEGQGQQSPAREGQQQNGQQPHRGEGDQEKKKEDQAARPQSESEKNTSGQPENTKNDQDASSRDQDGSTPKQEEKPTPHPDVQGSARHRPDSSGTNQTGERQQVQGRAQQTGSGTMTREEARALLESLRDQEGLPVYVPADTDTRAEKNSKNW
jgi:Ca-activated chloride channel family protein